MTKTKVTKKALASSLLALMLCVSMLLGTTYAWFTDSVTSAGNVIKSGTLDVEMWYADGTTDPDNATWNDASTGAIFNYDLWEPGYTEVRHIQIKNVGTLALKYKVQIVANGTVSDLADVIDVYYMDPAEKIADRTALAAKTPMGTLTVALAGMAATASGNLKAGEADTVTIALKMQESAGNEYQNKSIGTDFSIQLLATQWTYEEDSFDDQYDALAEGFSISASATYSTTENTVIKTGNTAAVGNAEVTIPAGVATVNGEFLAGDENVNLNIEKTETPANFTLVDGASGTTTYEVSLETDSGAKIESSGDAFLVKLNIGVVELQGFYHNNVAMTSAATLDEVDENGEYFYDVNTGIVTFMTTSFSPFTSTYSYDGGLGTASYPYLIGSGKQWYNLLTDYQGNKYMGSSTDGIYVDLIGDIDITGYDISGYSAYPRNFHLNGNGFKMMNFETTIWGGEGATMYLVNTFKDLKLENCHSSNDALFSQTQNSDTASVVFDNVDLDNCSAVGGAYQYYDGSASATFVNCNATNTHVIGDYMASAGFVGNISGGIISIDNCTFGGSVVSTQSMCAGFVGQPKNDDASVIIRNSEILPGTVIRNVSATGKVAAFDGMRTNRDYAAYNNEFNGTLETVNASSAYAQGTSAAKVPYAPICTANDFSFDTVTGTLTYNGESELGKAAVQVYVTDDYIYNGKYSGGYNWYLCDPIKKENVVSGTQITGVPIVTDFYNVVSSNDTPVGLKTTDATYVDEIHDGVFYFDAQTYSWGHYMLGGTYDNTTGTAKEPTSINVYIRITVYGTDGSLNGAISGSLLKYTVDLSNHGN